MANWLERALRVTPNGSQTLSKSAVWYGEGVGPSHVVKGEGAVLVDVDGKQYIDFVCGMGSVSLGYRCEAVDNAVMQAVVEHGVGHTLPHVLEVEVAERLVDAILCAEMVRFVKTGSEACAGAARIARAATGRDRIVVVGYHGWHDWYAASKPYHPGVPRPLEQLVTAVPYNDEESLKAELENGDIAAVMLEPTLVEHPKPAYLQNVVCLAHRYGALAIFDEMVCGFRWALAGGQEYFAVSPDLATFGKAMGNGYPIACIVGRRDLMRLAWTVSGTFGGDVVGLAACKAVLDEYAGSTQPIARMWERGRRIMAGMKAIIHEYDVPYEVDGWEVHPRVKPNAVVDYSTYMTALVEGLASRGILIHPAGFNVSAALTDSQILDTLEALDEVCHSIAGRSCDEVRTSLRSKRLIPQLDSGAAIKSWYGIEDSSRV